MDKELVCEDCEGTKNVQETLCPYDEEITGRETRVVICDSCYTERCQDI